MEQTIQIPKGRAFQAVGSGYAKILHVSKLAVLEGEQEGHVTTDREGGNRRR